MLVKFYHLIQLLSHSTELSHDCNLNYEKILYGNVELIGNICV